MTIIIILIATYVISVISAYKATRRWHLANDVTPDFPDILFVFFPVINVVVALHYRGELSHGGFANMFFRINDKEVSDNDED